MKNRIFTLLTLSIVVSSCAQQAEPEAHIPEPVSNALNFAAYSVTPPNGWLAPSGNISIGAIQQQRNTCDWAVASRGCRIGKEVFSSQTYPIETCALKTIDECIAAFPAGSFVTIETSYRPEETIDEVIAHDTALFGAFRISTGSIAGQTTYEQDIRCSSCTYAKRFVLTTQPHMTLIIEALSFGKETDKATLASHREEIDNMLATMSVRSL